MKFGDINNNWNIDEENTNPETEKNEDIEEMENASIDLEEFEKHNDKLNEETSSTFQMNMTVANEGDKIHLVYITSLSGTDEIVDQKDESDPLIIELGSGLLMQAFEEEISGMYEGEEKEFEIKNAYGPVNEKLVEKVYKDSLPESYREVGHMTTFKAPDGKYHSAKVISIDDEYVTIDLNNPLAGKDLKFYVKLIKIEKKD